MIQMRRKITVSMAARRDVKVTLHLVPLETAVDAARVDGVATAQLGRLGELLARVAAHLAEDVVHVGVLVLGLQPAGVLLAEGLVLVGATVGLVVALVHPQLPAGGLALEQLAGQDAVTGGVLDVDVEGIAGHLDDDVQVQLEVVRDALLDAEVVVLGAAEPGAEFGDGENGADNEDEDGPLSAAAGGSGV